MVNRARNFLTAYGFGFVCLIIDVIMSTLEFSVFLKTWLIIGTCEE